MMKFVQAVLLFFLVFAPWQGSIALFGRRAALPWLSGFGLDSLGISNFGLTNLLSLSAQLAAVLFFFFHARIWRKSRAWELVFCLPMLMLLLRISVFDRHTFILLQGFSLVTALLYLLLWVRRGYLDLPLLKKWGAPLFSISCFAAITFPLIFRIEGVPTFDIIHSPNIARYKGWHEFPSTIAFLSFQLCLVCFFYFRRGKAQSTALSLLLAGLVLLSAGITYLTTHRTSLLALLFVSGAYCVHYRRFREKVALGGIVFIFVLVGNFVGTVGIKNSWVNSLEASYLNHLRPEWEHKDTMSGDGFIVNSSGRMGLWVHMFNASKGHVLAGQGTGSSSRWMLNSPFTWGFGDQPHSETYRIYFEFGLIGLAIFACVIFMLYRAGILEVPHLFLAYFGMIPFAVLENPLIHPNWFLIPFSWVLILECMENPRKKNAA